jgi:hypothetical protein
MKTNSIKTAKGALTLIEPGIIKLILKENTEWGLEDAIETHKANLKLSNGKKYCVYHIASRFFIPTKEAQKYATSKECTDYRIAAAFIVGNSGVRVFANLFLKFFKSKSPSRIFKSEKEALIWLRSMYSQTTIASE